MCQMCQQEAVLVMEPIAVCLPGSHVQPEAQNSHRNVGVRVSLLQTCDTLHLPGVFSPHLGSGSDNTLFDHRQWVCAGASQVACGLATDGSHVEVPCWHAREWQATRCYHQKPIIHNPWTFGRATQSTVRIHSSHFLRAYTFIIFTLGARQIHLMCAIALTLHNG